MKVMCRVYSVIAINSISEGNAECVHNNRYKQSQW